MSNPAGFPYRIEPANLESLRFARQKAIDAWRLDLGSSRARCTLLKVNVILQDWDAAVHWRDAATCMDDPVLTRYPHILDGILLIQNGDLEQGRQELHQGLVRTGGFVSVSLEPWLRRISRPSQMPGPWQILEARIASGETPSPTYLLTQQNASPWPVGSQARWRLVGYDLSENDLEEGLPIETVLYWQALAEPTSVPARWIQVGDLWAQRVYLVNLIANGGFEWGRESTTDAPLGFARDSYGAPENHRVLWTKRVDKFSNVGLLSESSSGATSNFVTLSALPIASECIYVQGAWVRSLGHANIGRIWGETGVRGYMVQGRKLSDWRYYAEAFRPPSAATYAILSIVNWESPGDVMVDDLLFAALPDPEVVGRCCMTRTGCP